MKYMEEQCAALAAGLIDEELMWRLSRMPRPDDQTALDKAILREAQRRGLRTEQPAR